MTPTLALAAAIVRAWTRLYTWRAPRHERDARRAEIRSDLWEFARDPFRPRGLAAAAHVLARLVLGVPDDLAWRASHRAANSRSRRRTVAVAASMGALVLAALWVYEQARPQELPVPPRMMRFVAAPPPPPDISLPSPSAIEPGSQKPR